MKVLKKGMFMTTTDWLNGKSRSIREKLSIRKPVASLMNIPSPKIKFVFRIQSDYGTLNKEDR